MLGYEISGSKRIMQLSAAVAVGSSLCCIQSKAADNISDV